MSSAWFSRLFKSPSRVHPPGEDFRIAFQDIGAALGWHCTSLEVTSTLGKMHFSSPSMEAMLVYDVPASEVEIHAFLNFAEGIECTLSYTSLLAVDVATGIHLFYKRTMIQTEGEGKAWLIQHSIDLWRALELALIGENVRINDESSVIAWIGLKRRVAGVKE